MSIKKVILIVYVDIIYPKKGDIAMAYRYDNRKQMRLLLKRIEDYAGADDREEKETGSL